MTQAPTPSPNPSATNRLTASRLALASKCPGSFAYPHDGELPGKAPATEGSGTLVAAKLDLAVQATDGSFWTATSVLTVPEGAYPEPV